jgi:Tfp pilus assembly protein PilF
MNIVLCFPLAKAPRMSRTILPARNIEFLVCHRAAALIAAAGLIVRLVYLYQIVESPIFPMMATDSEYFDTIARYLLKGDWGHPDTIFLNPFYPIFLAGIYALCDGGPVAVIAVQVLLDCVSILLLVYIGSVMANRRVGLVAAGLYAFYGMAVFYTGLLLAPCLAIFFSLTAIALLLWYQNARKSWLLILAGLVFGLLILTRFNVVLFAPILFLWLVIKEKPPLRLRSTLIGCLLLLLGMGLPLMLNSLRTAHFHGEFHPFSVQGGINFYIGNNPDAGGIIMSPQGIPALPVTQVQTSIRLARQQTGRPLTPFQASNYWLFQGLRYLIDQPMDALSLYIRKLALFWRSKEITLNIDYDLSREWVPIMRLPLVSFGFAAPFAFIGLVTALTRPRQYFLVTGYFLIYMISVVIFFVADCYRLPSVPFLCLLAALAVDYIVMQCRNRSWRSVWPISVILCLTAFGINYGFESFAGDKRSSQGNHYNNLGLAYLRKNDLHSARKELEKAVEIVPDYHVIHNNLGIVWMKLGKVDAAQIEFEKAVNLNASYCKALYNLGTAHHRKHDVEQAKMWYQDAIACDSNAARAHTNLATILIKEGALQDAEYHRDRALAANRNQVEAHLAFGELETKRGNA